MGFLDHSTNNIIIDAVLTDEGRRRLAANDGSFRISMFSLADDEVDYSFITKFGRQVGKEKIAKNTPIFEAQTHKDYAMKNRLITLANRTIQTMPSFDVTVSGAGYNSTSKLVTFSSNQSSATVTLEQRIAGQQDAQIPDGLSDTSYSVLIPDRFLRISGGGSGRAYIDLTPNTRIATYKVLNTSRNQTTNGSILSLQLQKKGLSITDYSVYGTPPNNSEIDSVVSVIGDQSGVRFDFSVKIQRN